MGKLMNRIPSLRLLISILPGSALRTHIERSASLAMSPSVLIALPGKLSIKRHSPSIFYVLDMSAFYICCLYSDALQTTVVNGIKPYGL